MRIPSPSPAMAVALIALVLSTTGTTIAASSILLPRGSVSSAQIKDRSIALSDITFGTITSLKRPSGAAGGVLGGTYPRPTFAPGAVTATSLADGSVLASKIGDGVITGSKLADGSIGGSKLADGIVTGSKLADGVITGSKLADGSVGGSKIMSGSIDSSDLVANEPWQSPSLGFGWGTSSLSGFQEASFRKARFGEVQLRGEAWKNASDGGSVIFTLPPGYRPLKQRKFAIASHDDDGGVVAAGLAIVFPDGDVLIYGTTNDENISLDGIRFDAGE